MLLSQTLNIPKNFVFMDDIPLAAFRLLLTLPCAAGFYEIRFSYVQLLPLLDYNKRKKLRFGFHRMQSLTNGQSVHKKKEPGKSESDLEGDRRSHFVKNVERRCEPIRP